MVLAPCPMIKMDADVVEMSACTNPSNQKGAN